MMLKRFVCLFGTAGLLACMAQEFEIGGAAGYAFYRNATVTRGNESANVGFQNGMNFSALGGHQMHKYLGGEVRYTYRDNDAKISSGGKDFTFAGRAHLVHYDALLTAGSTASRVRPYAAFGGGIKIYQGTGIEQERQPLQNFAVATRTSELLPLLSLGGGVLVKIGGHAFLRFDFRDYITPFPTEVIMPAPGASLKGWLHDLTPMVGISAFF